VSHSYLEFYSHAIEVSLEQQQWSEARRYARALEVYTEREPMPLTDLQIQRARLLADIGEGKATAETWSALEQVRDSCLRMNAETALKAVEEALARSASKKEGHSG